MTYCIMYTLTRIKKDTCCIAYLLWSVYADGQCIKIAIKKIGHFIGYQCSVCYCGVFWYCIEYFFVCRI